MGEKFSVSEQQRAPSSGSRRRVIENKHLTDIGAGLISRVNAHTYARRRRRIFNVGRVLVLNYPPIIQTR